MAKKSSASSNRIQGTSAKITGGVKRLPTATSRSPSKHPLVKHGQGKPATGH